jgi:predicted nucleotidyltransferase
MRSFIHILQSHEVALAYLFGSQLEAGSAYLEGSSEKIESGRDLDLGVVFLEFPKSPFLVYGDLYADLAPYFEPFALDLVFLQETSYLFQHEAIQGNLIYCKDEQFLDDYEEMVLKRAADLSFKQIAFRRDFFEAIEHGYFPIEPE